MTLKSPEDINLEEMESAVEDRTIKKEIVTSVEKGVDNFIDVVGPLKDELKSKIQSGKYEEAQELLKRLLFLATSLENNLRKNLDVLKGEDETEEDEGARHRMAG